MRHLYIAFTYNIDVIGLLAGAALIGFGLWLWWPPAGFVAGGVLLSAVTLYGFQDG